MPTKQEALAKQAWAEWTSPYGSKPEREFRSRLTLDGICPDSGHTFEACSQSVCDCGWDILPWNEADAVS